MGRPKTGWLCCDGRVTFVKCNKSLCVPYTTAERKTGQKEILQYQYIKKEWSTRFWLLFRSLNRERPSQRVSPETAQIRWSHRKSCPIVLCNHEQTSSSSWLSTLSSSLSIPDQISCGRVMSIKLRCPQNYCPCAVACNDNAHSVTVCSCARVHECVRIHNIIVSEWMRTLSRHKRNDRLRKRARAQYSVGKP